jgi:hypothetical protein
MNLSRAKTSSLESAFPQPVTASSEDIRHAEELRRQIEQRYLARRDIPDPYWCVGVE